ncbi:MAG TPA: exosortase [Phycisphaerales bacterium]|nr:exosortase [Phycisphaerales bacterium]
MITNTNEIKAPDIEDAKVLILAGDKKFGKHDIAGHFNRALWPIVDRPVLEHLIEQLTSQGARHFVVCSQNQCQQLKDALNLPDDLDVQFHQDALARGTAGCMKDAADTDREQVMIVLSACTIVPPDIRQVLSSHTEAKVDMTVVFNKPVNASGSLPEVTPVYACNSSILKYVPENGFFDLKEGLLPELIGKGHSINALTISGWTEGFVTWSEYLAEVSVLLEDNDMLVPFLPAELKPDENGVYISSEATVDPTARVYGPAVICKGARVSADAVILGPAVLGENVMVASGTLIENSILWAGANVAGDCEIQGCVIEQDVVVPSGRIIRDESVTRGACGKIAVGFSGAVSRLRTSPQVAAAIMGSILMTVFVWSYWQVIADLWHIWMGSDEYSSGMLVPIIAAYILWSRRQKLSCCKIGPCLYAAFIFVAAQLMRAFGLYYMYSSAERLSMVVSFISIILLIGGVSLFAKIWPVLLFMCLMLPLPVSVHSAVMLPLQNMATSSAVFCLEVFGLTVTRQGNLIHLNDVTVAVSEACNGLRMVMAFFVITALLVLLVKRTWWEKLIVLVSALPVALICNSVRLTVTSIVFMFIDGRRWEGLFHDFGGYAMMPLAITILVAELWLLDKLFRVDGQVLQIVYAKKN